MGRTISKRPRCVAESERDLSIVERSPFPHSVLKRDLKEEARGTNLTKGSAGSGMEVVELAYKPCLYLDLRAAC